MREWGSRFLLLICFLLLVASTFAGNVSDSSSPDTLERGFASPPDATKPWVYWYWISDNISKEGLTRDLEAMARVGIGEALIGNIFLDNVPAGKIKVLSPEWWGLIEHAMREGGRLGVDIGMFNCPGWSQSGGPWIKPEQAMRYLTYSETRVTGPTRFNKPLVSPKEQFQDVAVLAFPAPQNDAERFADKKPHVSCTPVATGAEKLVDGDLSTVFEFPGGAGRGNQLFNIEFKTSEEFTARSLSIAPSKQPFGANCELLAEQSDGEWASVRKFKFDRSNMATGVGFMPQDPVTISFPPTVANKFRLVFTGLLGPSGKPSLSEVDISPAARLEYVVEKQLGKMHPTPLPMWDTYLWPTQDEPGVDGLVIPEKGVQNITQYLSDDGTLAWDVPSGEWVILRMGMTPTGMRNSPASPEGQGLEVDKMNRSLAKYHFDSFIGEVIRRVAPKDRVSFKHVVADSYEMGSQNWTDGFEKQFQECYGYDPLPWLPVLSGRVIGSADQSERFLWDLRRLVADRIATEYVGGLRDASNSHGLESWLENYGHWGFPSEFLKYGSESDRIGGEYWVTGDLGSIECRAASSCANTYGKKFVSAESFTGGPAFQNAPMALKARGDWAFCEGVNHFVLHVYIHQPWEDRVPGVNAWFGTEFNRHNTWFEQSRAWVDYLRRSCYLLQQGVRVADVAYFIGDDAPKMTGIRNPELPVGRDFDYINGEVIADSLDVENGVLTLPHGTQYRVLVLPDLPTMRPELLRKIRNLVRKGATVYGKPPLRSPSLENYPRSDQAIRKLAEELWGKADFEKPGEHRLGKGRVVWGSSLEAVFESLDSEPDFTSSDELRFTHRRDGETDIYFVANPKAEPLTTTVAFRVGDKAPELWYPNSGRIERPAVYSASGQKTSLPLSFGPHGSVFVMFREKGAPKSQRISTVRYEGKEILGTEVTPYTPNRKNGDSPNNFTFAIWVKPKDDTTLTAEANKGIVGMGDKRNDVVTPPHGSSFGGDGHAGTGLAVGRNGVSVFEHGAGYFAPPLVYKAALTDWTHVAVVYRDGQPNLYLNGVFVRKGLKSQHIAHSGAGEGVSAQYRGATGSFTQFSRSLDNKEIAALAQAMPRPDSDAYAPSISFVREKGKLIAQSTTPGNYDLLFADGKKHTLQIPALSAIETLAGPWQVQFKPVGSIAKNITFDRLVSWPEHTDESIRHYSGSAIYRKSFELSQAQAANSNGRIIIDLGEVKDMAVVRVNGKALGTLWLPPWQVDITDVTKAGTNSLEIEVVNTWNNRLVGDAGIPEEKRKTFLLGPKVKGNSPLLDAGLIGLVRIVHQANVSILAE